MTNNEFLMSSILLNACLVFLTWISFKPLLAKLPQWVRAIGGGFAVGCFFGIEYWVRDSLLLHHTGQSLGQYVDRISVYTFAPTLFLYSIYKIMAGTIRQSGGLWNALLRPGRHADIVLRGAEIVSSDELAKMTFQPNADQVKIGELPLPVEAETKHILVPGGTGSGKSLSFNWLMVSARRRKQKAIIVDLEGASLSKFYREGDFILNPFDSRSQQWSPMCEIKNVWDIDLIKKSMIPDNEGEIGEWRLHAQNVLAVITKNLLESGRADNQNLYESLIIKLQSELKEVVAGTPAQRIFEPGADRMLQGVLSIISTFFSPYQYLPKSVGPNNGFSIKDWMQRDDDSWLFINVSEGQLKSLGPLIATWLDVAITALLALPPSQDRRVWFFMDELASYQINNIEALLTKSRKNGGVAVGAVQQLSQLRKIYGNNDAQTLLGNFSSKLVLRQADTEIAEHFAKYLGSQEVLRRQNSGNKSNNGQGKGKSDGWSEQITLRQIVLPSQLIKLPDRVGYLSLVGDFPVAKITVPGIDFGTSKVEPFIPAKM